MAAVRDGRRRMRDERVVGGCRGSRMTITRYRIGGSKAGKQGNGEAGGSQNRRGRYRTSVS